ncbi:MAG: cation-translocating P-type ATPase [Butyrivibrio sp.]|nr:cation-translocating P-type ATPase [Acetatifactor muris]MCM1560339.1 cation-translocating P-type ATPase [Butyrivibrio sp.]
MFERYSVRDTVRELKSDDKRGLTAAEAGKRLAAYGRNEMRAPRKKTVAESFLEQLNDPLIYVLIVAAAVSVFLGEISDAVIIGVVVLLNAVVGVLQEGKAKRALESLKKLTSPKAFVIRDGRRLEIPAAELVPGDLVYLEAGCQVPADLRLVQTANLKVEESALTGEAVPVDKDSGFLPGGARGGSMKGSGKNSSMGIPTVAPTGSHREEISSSAAAEIPLGDRHNMAYMSTIVTYGRGEGIVTATGMDTELGKIAIMITEAKEELTPLQRRLGELGKVLSLLSLLLCAVLFVIAVLQHRDIPEMLITAISLAVAAVPEGLPAVVTICLALSVTRMVRVNTIVRRLPSVETLGAVSVVCSDKTGTLTQNRMTVEKCFVKGRILQASELRLPEAPDFFLGMVLCNDALLEQGSRTGDPTELALLDFGEKAGLRKEEAEERLPRTDELSFDSDRKMMTTLHGSISYTKGAPDEVLKRCTYILTGSGTVRFSETARRQVREAMAEMSGEALRTLAVAMRSGAPRLEESELTFLGLVGMRDPARPEAARAAADFKAAGVTTVMITGDHIDTAFAIGKQLGIVERFEQCMTGETLGSLTDEELAERLEDTKVFARVSPAQKVRIVDGFQSRGEIVAMTGDGVNDAPSLKAADIGIAMGKAGTDVARQAADMVLTDDNFATIRRAIEEGRGVYENIRKSVIFLLSSNLGEIVTMFLAVVCGLAAPLKSSHILWINLITDSLPALALGVDKNDGKSLMRQQPRKASESLFARGGLVCTCFYGVLIAAVSLSAFLMLPIALLHIRGLSVSVAGLGEILQEEWVLSKAQTYAFTVLGMSQLFHAVGMRDTNRSVLKMNHLENKLMLAACVIGFLLQFAVTEVPFLIQAFGTSPLSGREWMRLSLLAAAPLLAHEIMCLVSSLFPVKH